MNDNLMFRPDGTFTIVQFTDLHWHNGEPEDRKTKALMERVLKEERPDLIVLTGDVIESLRCKDPLQAYRDAVSVVEASGIPWVTLFGNHDAERNVTKEQLLGVQLEHSGTIIEPGPEEVDGLGNFVVRVADSNGEAPALALFFLDSGAYSELPTVPGYDWIHQSQIDWYQSQASRIQEQNEGVPLPSLAFFHIPLPEYREAWDREICYGHRYEKVQSPTINSGFFAEMVRAGGMMGTFCGHDHINDYEGRLHGIRLCYGRATGYNTYGRSFFQRGARVIRISQGENDFTTWLHLANGKKVTSPRQHSPVWYSRA